MVVSEVSGVMKSSRGLLFSLQGYTASPFDERSSSSLRASDVLLPHLAARLDFAEEIQKNSKDMDQPTTSTIQSSNAPIAPALTSDQRAQVKQLEQPFNCPPLPLDVVYHILQLGSEVDLTAGPVPPPDQTRHRLNFLSTASLISSSWRKEAQKLMYQHVILSSRLQLKSFRALTIAIPSIASLRFGPASHGIRRVDGYDVGAILARCSGIDSLILEGVASLDTAALLADNLAGEFGEAARSENWPS